MQDGQGRPTQQALAGTSGPQGPYHHQGGLVLLGNPIDLQHRRAGADLQGDLKPLVFDRRPLLGQFGLSHLGKQARDFLLIPYPQRMGQHYLARPEIPQPAQAAYHHVGCL